MTEKRCSKCREIKPIDEFCRDRSSKDGRFCHCRDCRRRYNEANRERRREYNQQYYREHRSRYLAYKHRYYWDNTEKILEQNREYKKRKRREKNQNL